jgi:hypothetical protein
MRKQLSSPLGWNNTTEMAASIVDAINVLTRVTMNVNSTKPIQGEIPRVPRPYEDKAPEESKGISLSDFAGLIQKGDQR